MPIDSEAAYRAVQSRDARFDGTFYTGVLTTGIYCRPSCSARTPHRHNVDFYPSAAAAQRAGFRACKMCRPDATPGSADWDIRADLAGRAIRLIADGVIDREGVSGLARQLGYSERQISRALVSEMGAPPLALARAQRAQTARILLENTDLAASDVAFAAGFASIRQFNDTIREVFASTPTQLRQQPPGRISEPGTIDLRLAYRPPMDLPITLNYLAQRAIAGIEHYDGLTLRRTMRLPHGAGLVALTPAAGHVEARLRLADHRDLAAAVARIRRLLDLDADPQAVDEVLSAQPALAELIRRHPGLRSPGAVDGFEMAVRAVVGQQVSVAGARTVLGRIVSEYGTNAFETGSEWLLFPEPAALAGIDPTTLPMPAARGRTIVTIAEAMAIGELNLTAGSDREQTRQDLLALRGVGPWTADYLQMRAIGDPDIYLGSDLGIKHAVAALAVTRAGLDPDATAPFDPVEAAKLDPDATARVGSIPAAPADPVAAAPFDPVAAAPWRSYLTHHLWASLHSAEPKKPKTRKPHEE
ncbi:MAG: helix-turn-helix domain-containing protein [Actinomycetota bacterium]|nr:helix-turn-helix domain-containing protein [Actinomycetota bacterium]MDQ2959027.1 helix-turn-helix domain-containing protein [Actinomycetota bacterium]